MMIATFIPCFKRGFYHVLEGVALKNLFEGKPKDPHLALTTHQCIVLLGVMHSPAWCDAIVGLCPSTY